MRISGCYKSIRGRRAVGPRYRAGVSIKRMLCGHLKRVGMNSREIKGMADIKGETSNLNRQCDREVAGPLARAIAGPSIARNSREIRGMADIKGETSNSLFKTLEDWNTHLKAENIDPWEPRP